LLIELPKVEHLSCHRRISPLGIPESSLLRYLLACLSLSALASCCLRSLHRRRLRRLESSLALLLLISLLKSLLLMMLKTSLLLVRALLLLLLLLRSLRS
jgi:hypothetical protein